MTGRPAWPALVVAALVSIAVVSLGDPDAGVPVGAAVVAAGAVAATIVVVATGVEHRDQHPFPYGILLLRLTPVPLGLLGALALWLLPEGERSLDERPPVSGVGEERRGKEEDTPGIDVIDVIDAIYAVLLVLTVALALYLALRLLRRWHRKRGAPSSALGETGRVTESDDPERWRRESQRRAVRTGLAQGRAALLDETDPRLAIVRAYLAFEDHVRREGLVRLPAETQREYAARVLAAGGVTEPRHVTELVELFNAARFSIEPMDEADATAARDHIVAMVEA